MRIAAVVLAPKVMEIIKLESIQHNQFMYTSGKIQKNRSGKQITRRTKVATTKMPSYKTQGSSKKPRRSSRLQAKEQDKERGEKNESNN